MKLEREGSPVGTNPEKKLQTETHDLSTDVLDRVKALIADYNSKLCQSPPLFGIEASRGPQNEINIQLEARSKFTPALLSKATGTVHKDLARDLIVQALMVLPPRVGEEQHALDAIISALLEIGPRDGLEGMLAVQLISLHRLAMQHLRKASTEKDPGMAFYRENQAAKTLRLFRSQLEGLFRYRSRGQQKIIVKHVHVNEGGQAVIGNIQSSKGGDPGAT